MAYPQTGSTLYDAFGKNRTGTSLSTNIIIKVGTVAIGAVQSLQINETRPIHMIDEVGTDGHIDSAPNQSTKISGSCQRVRFDQLRVAEAFSRGFVHAHSQRYPFDIDIIDTVKGDGNNSIVTTLKNVWIGSIAYTYQANDFIITDTMGWECESIQSFFSGNGSSNVAEGGVRGIQFFNDSIERSADRGGRRGSLDAPGLISSFFGVNPF